MKVKITLLLTTLVFLVLATKSNAQEQKSNEQGISKNDILEHYLSQIKLDSIALSKENSFGENKNGTNASTSVQDNQDPSSFWKINGNFGTDSDVNFVGTTDNEDLTFKRGNVFSGRLGFLITSYGYLTGKGGFSNVNIGRKAGSNSNLIQNFYNISIGESAGFSNETGSLNTFVGVFAGTKNTSGIGNTFIGADSGRLNTTGNSNTAIGFRSLLKNTTGDYNISLSNGALENNTTGSHNIAIGSWSMQKNEIGDDNIGIGHSAGQFSTGSHNIFFGEAAGKSIESGDNNLFLGYYTGHFLNQGSENIFIGSKSGYSTTVGTKNLFLGNSSGVINGSNNIAIGEYAGGNTGNGNILIGNNSKINPGFQTNPLNDNFLNIGNVVFGYNMNRVSSADNTAVRPGMIGINTTVPKTALEVNSEIKDVSGLRFTNLKSNYNPTTLQSTNKFLTVNQDGDVVLQYMANLNTTNVLASNENTMTTNVNTITSSAPIINSIANSFNSSNELITTVNGVSSNPITIPIPNFTEIDGSVTNELQTLSQSGNTITLSNNGGSFTLPTFTDTDAQALTLTGNNLSISNGNTVVLPTTNVIAGTNVTVTGNGSTALPFQISAQDDDEQSLTLVGNNLSISNGNTVVLPTFTEIDGSVTNELQTLTQTGNTVTLSNNGGSFILPTDTDNQTLTLTGNTLSIADGNSVVLPTTNVIAGTNVTVTGNGSTASPFQISAQDEDEQSLTLVGNNLSISNGNTVVLPTFTEIDGSVTNELQTLTQTGNTVTLSNNGGSFTLPIDTDNQTLTLTGNTLSIADGNSVVLPTTNVIAGTNVTVTGNGSTASPFQISAQDDDEQSLTLVGNNLSISNGNTVVLPTFTEIDGSVTNELQTLTQTGNTVTLSNNGGSFTLPTDTDNQTLTLTGNTLSIADGNSVVLPTTNVIAGTNVTVTGNGSTASPFEISAQDEDEQTLTLSGNNLSISNGNSITLPTTNVTAGTNVTVTGTGTSANPFVIASNDTSLYAANGTINPATTTNNNRVVNMNNRNIWFNTATSSSNGKIYIGSSTSYPTTTGDYKLYVEGGILTEKVKVALRSTTNWADYVFDEKYNLMPLSEVEKFVTQNKHLPGIDSASELFKNGIDLAEMQSKQMEKIEELTLYIINQNKTLEQQSTALENQNKEIEELKLQVKALIEKTK